MMPEAQAVVKFVARQAYQAAVATPAAATSTAKPACDTKNDYDGRIGLRVSAIFVILIGSTFGRLSKSIIL